MSEEELKYEEKFIVINTKYINHLAGALYELSPQQKDAVEDFEKALLMLQTLDVIPENNYYVCNQDEPYALHIIETILTEGKYIEDKDSKIKQLESENEKLKENQKTLIGALQCITSLLDVPEYDIDNAMLNISKLKKAKEELKKIAEAIEKYYEYLEKNRNAFWDKAKNCDTNTDGTISKSRGDVYDFCLQKLNKLMESE